MLPVHCSIPLQAGQSFLSDSVDLIFKGEWMHHRNSVGKSLSKGLYNAKALQIQPRANAVLLQTGLHQFSSSLNSFIKHF